MRTKARQAAILFAAICLLACGRPSVGAAPAADKIIPPTAAGTQPLPITAPKPAKPKNIGLNLKDANVVDVFRLLAEQNNLNVIISPEVTGTISLRLNDVTFDDALRVVLDASNTQSRRSDRILYIYPKASATAARTDFVTEVFNIKFAPTQNIITIITPMLAQGGRAQTFGASNDTKKSPFLVITDAPENIEKIRKIVEKLDMETSQVMIEAKILTTSLSNDNIFGVDWTTALSFKGLPFPVDSKFAPGGHINYGTLNISQVQAIFDRLSTAGNADILSDIKIATLDGKSANIHVGESVPVGINSIIAGPSGGTAMGTTGIQSFNVGVSLDVTPVVLGTDIIQMQISPQVSNITGFTSLGSGVSQAPITTDRTADTNILLKSGETVVIAGLMQDTLSVTRKSVPILSKLPMVGNLFRSKSEIKEKSNLLIFITAHVMEKRDFDRVAEEPQVTPAGAQSASPDDKINNLLEVQ